MTVTLDDDQRYLVVASRDPRFDGWFVTAVRTTGIYCRPSCPAITPKRANVVLPQRGDRAACRLPGLPAVSSGCHAGVAGVGCTR